MTIYGLEFFGRGLNNTVTVNVGVFTVNPADSTPAVQLGTTTIALTQTTTSLSAMARHAVFSSPITVNGPYAVVVQGVTTNTDTFQLVTNDDGDGQGERLSQVRVLSTVWLNVEDGYGVDADFLAHPIVSYTLAANFSVAGTLCEGDPVSFTSTSSPILNNRFYSQAAFFAQTDASYTWDFGDASTPVNQENPAHTYANAGTYSVTLTDTLFGWTITCTEDTMASLTINEPPTANMTLSSTTVNIGDTVSLTNTSIGSTSCVIDFGDGTPVITSCADTSHIYTVAGTYTVTITATNACGSDSYTQTVTVNAITGIGSSTLENSLSIFPNPATDRFTLRTPLLAGRPLAALYTMSGELVMQVNLAGVTSTEISTSALAAGVYFLRVTDANGTVVKRVDVVK